MIGRKSVGLASIPERNGLNFSWLIKLRWSEIAGQTATILGVYWLLRIDIPLVPLFTIVGIEIASNVGCALWFRRARHVAEWHVAAVMVLDVWLLTGLLYFTGGPFNPFSFLYLVNIALAAVVLHAEWTWMLVALSLLSFGLLQVDHRALPFGDMKPSVYLNIHQEGMWVAFGVAAAFIVYFLLRVTGALARRERELSEARNLAARQERLASLATMAAGAAHELSTPLGTIALVAKELERGLGRSADAGVVEDIQLIRQQVARCRMILDQMSVGVGKSAGDAIETLTLTELIEQSVTGVREAPGVRIDIAPGDGDTPVRLTPRAVEQALRGVITNAQDASPADRDVVVKVQVVGGEVLVEVRDHGRGMPEAVLARAGEPFFTTKQPGRGMGLGLFLTRAVVEKLGGNMDIDTEPGQGTRVSLVFPADVGQPPGAATAAGR